MSRVKVSGISLSLSPVPPSRPDAAQGDVAGENPSRLCSCVQKAGNDRPHPPRQASLPRGPRHFLFPCLLLTHPPQALPTFRNAHSSFQPRLGNGYVPHRGLRCTLGAKCQGRKPERKKWEQETSEWGLGEGACGNCSSSGSGLILIPQPFPPPPKPQPLCERKLGFVVPVLPGDKEWE